MEDITPNDLDAVPLWHFAIGGLESQQEAFELGRAIRLRRLRAFPTHEELAVSLNNLPVAGIVAHYGEDCIRHELVIDAEYIDDARRIPQTASAVLAGLRVRTAAEIVCPAVCDNSWATLKGQTGNRCKVYFVERGLLLQRTGEPTLVLREDLEWVREHTGTLISLSDDERFETALEALSSYMLAANDRMKAAQLWAGVESVFGRHFGEIGYRLGLLTALMLEARGPACRDFHRQSQKLWRMRNKVIHGEKVKANDLQLHVTDVRRLLARLLRQVIERGKMPSEEELEDLPFLA